MFVFCNVNLDRFCCCLNTDKTNREKNVDGFLKKIYQFVETYMDRFFNADQIYICFCFTKISFNKDWVKIFHLTIFHLILKIKIIYKTY